MNRREDPLLRQHRSRLLQLAEETNIKPGRGSGRRRGQRQAHGSFAPSNGPGSGGHVTLRDIVRSDPGYTPNIEHLVFPERKSSNPNLSTSNVDGSSPPASSKTKSTSGAASGRSKLAEVFARHYGRGSSQDSTAGSRKNHVNSTSLDGVSGGHQPPLAVNTNVQSGGGRRRWQSTEDQRPASGPDPAQQSTAQSNAQTPRRLSPAADAVECNTSRTDRNVSLIHVRSTSDPWEVGSQGSSYSAGSQKSQQSVGSGGNRGGPSYNRGSSIPSLKRHDTVSSTSGVTSLKHRQDGHGQSSNSRCRDGSFLSSTSTSGELYLTDAYNRELSPVRWCDREVDGVYLGRSGWVQVQQRSLDESRRPKYDGKFNPNAHMDSLTRKAEPKYEFHQNAKMSFEELSAIAQNSGTLPLTRRTNIKLADYHCSNSEPGKCPGDFQRVQSLDLQTSRPEFHNLQNFSSSQATHGEDKQDAVAANFAKGLELGTYPKVQKSLDMGSFQKSLDAFQAASQDSQSIANIQNIQNLQNLQNFQNLQNLQSLQGYPSLQDLERSSSCSPHSIPESFSPPSITPIISPPPAFQDAIARKCSTRQRMSRSYAKAFIRSNAIDSDIISPPPSPVQQNWCSLPAAASRKSKIDKARSLEKAKAASKAKSVEKRSSQENLYEYEEKFGELRGFKGPKEVKDENFPRGKKRQQDSYKMSQAKSLEDQSSFRRMQFIQRYLESSSSSSSSMGFRSLDSCFQKAMPRLVENTDSSIEGYEDGDEDENSLNLSVLSSASMLRLNSSCEELREKNGERLSPNRKFKFPARRSPGSESIGRLSFNSRSNSLSSSTSTSSEEFLKREGFRRIKRSPESRVRRSRSLQLPEKRSPGSRDGRERGERKRHVLQNRKAQSTEDTLNEDLLRDTVSIPEFLYGTRSRPMTASRKVHSRYDSYDNEQFAVERLNYDEICYVSSTSASKQTASRAQKVQNTVQNLQSASNLPILSNFPSASQTSPLSQSSQNSQNSQNSHNSQSSLNSQISSKTALAIKSVQNVQNLQKNAAAGQQHGESGQNLSKIGVVGGQASQKSNVQVLQKVSGISSVSGKSQKSQICSNSSVNPEKVVALSSTSKSMAAQNPSKLAGSQKSGPSASIQKSSCNNNQKSVNPPKLAASQKKPVNSQKSEPHQKMNNMQKPENYQKMASAQKSENYQKSGSAQKPEIYQKTESLAQGHAQRQGQCRRPKSLQRGGTVSNVTNEQSPEFVEFKKLREYDEFKNLSKDFKDSQERKDSREFDEFKTSRDLKDINDLTESRDRKNSREFDEFTGPREFKDFKDLNESYDRRDSRELDDPKNFRDFKDAKDSHDRRNSRESDDFKTSRDFRDAKEAKDFNLSPDTKSRCNSSTCDFWPHCSQRDNLYSPNQPTILMKVSQSYPSHKKMQNDSSFDVSKGSTSSSPASLERMEATESKDKDSEYADYDYPEYKDYKDCPEYQEYTDYRERKRTTSRPEKMPRSVLKTKWSPISSAANSNIANAANCSSNLNNSRPARAYVGQDGKRVYKKSEAFEEKERRVSPSGGQEKSGKLIKSMSGIVSSSNTSSSSSSDIWVTTSDRTITKSPKNFKSSGASTPMEDAVAGHLNMTLMETPKDGMLSRPGSAPTRGEDAIVKEQPLETQQRSLSLPKSFLAHNIDSSKSTSWQREKDSHGSSPVSGRAHHQPEATAPHTAPVSPLRGGKERRRLSGLSKAQRRVKASSTPALLDHDNESEQWSNEIPSIPTTEHPLTEATIPLASRHSSPTTEHQCRMTYGGNSATVMGTGSRSGQESVLQKFRKSFSLRFHKRGSKESEAEEERQLEDEEREERERREGREAGTSAEGKEDTDQKFRFGPLVWRSSKERKKGSKAARNAKCNSGDSGIQIEMVSGGTMTGSGGGGILGGGDSSESHDTDVQDETDSPPTLRRRLPDKLRPQSELINQILIDKFKADLQSRTTSRHQHVRRTNSDLGGQRLIQWDSRSGYSHAHNYRRMLSTPSPIKTRPPRLSPRHSSHDIVTLRSNAKGRSCRTNLRRSLSQPLGINQLSPLMRTKTAGARLPSGAVLSEDEHDVRVSDDEDEDDLMSDSESSLASLSERKKSFDQQPAEEEVAILAEAVWDHVAMEPEELAFRAGDVIDVLDTMDKDWWWGCCGEDVGWFPAAFVRLRVNQEDTVEDCLAAMASGMSSGGQLRRRTSVSLLSNEQVRTSVVRELVQTERDFVKILRDVVEGYVEECRRRTDMFTEMQIDTIFINIEELLDFQSEFLKDLESRIDWSAPHKSCVGECFLNHRAGFRMYSQYCNSHPMATATLQELYQHNRYSKFFEACRLMRGLIEIPLDGYLLTPVQRICKYPLQLAELLKYTRTDHPDYEKIREALEAMRGVAVLINERKRRMESLEKLAAWQMRVEGWEGEDLIEVSSQLIYQGEAIRVTTGMWTNNIILFLFDHQLVYCKKDLLKRNTYVYKGRIYLDTSEVIDVPDGKDHQLGVTVRHCLKVYSCVRDKWLLFCCRTADEKRRWLQAMAEERRLVAQDRYDGLEFPQAAKQLARLAATRFRNCPPQIKPPGKTYNKRDSPYELSSGMGNHSGTNSLGRKVGTWFTFGSGKKNARSQPS